MALQRRAEILEAFAESAVKHGLAKSSLVRVAEIAKVQPSLITHYFGPRINLTVALVDLVVDRYKRALARYVSRRRSGDPAQVLLEYLFTSFARQDIAPVVDELEAAANHEPRVRERMREMYEEFEAICRQAIASLEPDAPAALRDDLAYALVCLASKNATLIALGGDPKGSQRALRTARRLADEVIAVGEKRRRASRSAGRRRGAG